MSWCWNRIWTRFVHSSQKLNIDLDPLCLNSTLNLNTIINLPVESMRRIRQILAFKSCLDDTKMIYETDSVVHFIESFSADNIIIFCNVRSLLLHFQLSILLMHSLV